MPRKSANQIAAEQFAATFPGERPEPPADMTVEAAVVLRDVVASMKARHFTRETLALLARYCNLMGECARLEVALAGTGVDGPNHDRLNQRLTSTALAALSYARALLLTPKSNLETRGDARDPHRTTGLKPWELLDDDKYDEFGNPRPQRKMWRE